MPISATGCCSTAVVRAWRYARAQRGFTLMEMLVVLVIIAVAVAGTTLALRPDERRQLAHEAERLALLLAQAREESELGGMALAWVGAEDHYVFERRELTAAGPTWFPLTGDDLLRLRRLPEGLAIRRIEADGRRLAPGDRLVLDALGPRRISIELTLGQARSLVQSFADGFAVETQLGAES